MKMSGGIGVLPAVRNVDCSLHRHITPLRWSPLADVPVPVEFVEPNHGKKSLDGFGFHQ